MIECPNCHKKTNENFKDCSYCGAQLPVDPLNREKIKVPKEKRVNTNVVSVGQWIATLIVLALPLVNVVMVFIYAFGDYEESKKTFARAVLILIPVAFVIGLIVNLFY